MLTQPPASKARTTGRKAERVTGCQSCYTPLSSAMCQVATQAQSRTAKAAAVAVKGSCRQHQRAGEAMWQVCTHVRPCKARHCRDTMLLGLGVARTSSSCPQTWIRVCRLFWELKSKGVQHATTMWTVWGRAVHPSRKQIDHLPPCRFQAAPIEDATLRPQGTACLGHDPRNLDATKPGLFPLCHPRSAGSWAPNPFKSASPTQFNVATRV